MKKIRIFEGFAGYGGGSFGLKRLKEKMPDFNYEVIGYSEFDKYASELFAVNHKHKNGKPLKNWGDITKILLYKSRKVDLYSQICCLYHTDLFSHPAVAILMLWNQ